MQPLSLFLAITACNGPDDTDPGVTLRPVVVPEPVLVESQPGSFLLGDDTTIAGPGAELLAASLRPSTGLPLEVVDAGATITFRLDAASGLGPEGYTLDVGGDGVVITAATEAGLFYGGQTFRQLLPAESFGTAPADVPWVVPYLHVEDAPRFEYRGLMLDVARHFFPVEDVKRQIDLMAMHKLNRLHLHLTDDQGWRIEIKAKPLLTEIGGSTEVGGGPGGFYTQEDWQSILDYAAERHIVLIPELDFPGHAHAALASYGELNEEGVPLEFYTGAAVLSTPLCMDCPATRPFVEAVWREMCSITPGPWVHVGADEAIGVNDDDYRDFLQWLQGVIAEEGKIMIGWDEIGVVALDPPFIAQHWYDEDRARAAVDQGAMMIASPARRAYFDMIHDQEAEFGQVWGGPIDVKTAYAWAPAPPGVPVDSVIGIESALWTELVDDREKMDLMLWPRLSAQSELDWSAASDWEDFRERLAIHGQRLDRMGVGFYRTPEVDWLD